MVWSQFFLSIWSEQFLVHCCPKFVLSFCYQLVQPTIYKILLDRLFTFFHFVLMAFSMTWVSNFLSYVMRQNNFNSFFFRFSLSISFLFSFSLELYCGSNIPPMFFWVFFCWATSLAWSLFICKDINPHSLPYRAIDIT